MSRAGRPGRGPCWFRRFVKGTVGNNRARSRESLVVVGNGIASVRFCEEAVALGLGRRFEITVIGAEPHPAYDRVRLSSFVKDRNAENLVFHPADWYEEHGIRLLTGERVTSIDRDKRTVGTASGGWHGYDRLVLATGSSAFVPPVPGVDLPGVIPYRAIGDVEAIMSAGARSGIVIGGGLLGLEAAQALQHLGLDVTIIERADFPMPRQLNAAAGEMVIARIERLGLAFYGGFSTREIRRGPGELEVVAEDGSVLSADLVVISAGITPNSALAAEAGLLCGVRGGVVVDDFLRTADDRILAIGECALHRGQVYGLAAPAGAMGRQAARMLAGKRSEPFGTPDLSTRLKMLGIEVTTIGDPIDRGRVLEHADGDIYRLITLDGDRVPVGALAIGRWPEAGLLHGWHLEKRALREKEAASFVADGLLDPASAGRSVSDWPDERLVCNCMRVSKGDLCHAMATGACTPPALAAATGASTVCGSCRPLVEELCGAPVNAVRGYAALMLIVVAVAAIALGLVSLAFEFPVAKSVDSLEFRLNRLWSDTLPKQITGYSLLGIALLGLLISLRKRLPRFRFGAFAKWRLFHAGFGLLSLVVLFAHTGFRFGANLNACLMGVFVGLNLLGAVAGIAAGLETRGSPQAASLARRFRPGLTLAHYVLFWPLPVLVAFHIASVYLY